MESQDMEHLKTYSIRGVSIPVHRVRIAARTVDYWAPQGSEHLIVTHDGQNIFDRRTATRGFTWRLAQQATSIFAQFGLRPPTIIAVFHSGGDPEPHGRALDLTPESHFRSGMPVLIEVPQDLTVDQLRGDQYLDRVFELIVPTLLQELGRDFSFDQRAMLGSSMGGLSTLYEIGRRPDRYSTALAFSPHWVLGGEKLVEAMIKELPKPGKHKIWMSRGTKNLDREYEPHQELANGLMRDMGWSSENFHSKVYKGAGHNERAWSKQVADGLKFWLED